MIRWCKPSLSSVYTHSPWFWEVSYFVSQLFAECSSGLNLLQNEGGSRFPWIRLKSFAEFLPNALLYATHRRFHQLEACMAFAACILTRPGHPESIPPAGCHVSPCPDQQTLTHSFLWPNFFQLPAALKQLRLVQLLLWSILLPVSLGFDPSGCALLMVICRIFATGKPMHYGSFPIDGCCWLLQVEEQSSEWFPNLTSWYSPWVVPRSQLPSS